MPRRYLRTVCPSETLREDFARIRTEFGVRPAFPDDVEEHAAAAAARPPARHDRDDMRAVDFVTVDPPGSLDLDQAMHLEPRNGGYRVRYAIADVAAFVERGSVIDQEAWRRGVTVYCPDLRTPLYPTALSEGAASLLPDTDRPAIVFTIDLDAGCERTAATVTRAVVRSRAKLAYADAEIPYLEEIGRLRQRAARRRGAVHLQAPAQQVVAAPESDSGFVLRLEPRLEIEDWNAEISLLAGMAAADLMVESGLGALRVMDGVVPARIGRLRETVRALGVDWPAGRDFDDFATSLRPTEPRELAVMEEVRDAMGRAGYAFFEGAPTREMYHAGLAARYAHATAPLRRLQDRYVLDTLVGEADREALVALPRSMSEAESRAGRVERAVVDQMETRLLEHRVGESFTAWPVEHERRGTAIVIREPPVRARMPAQPPPPLGEPVEVRLVRADPISRSLQFTG